VWALLGLAVAARGADGPSCRVHNDLDDGSTNIGSGTLVDVAADGSRGLVLTCAHLFSEGRGRVVVQFAGGRTHGANVIAVDPDADLAALEIASPQAAAAAIAFEVEASDQLAACGFGPNGAYRCVSGRVVGAAEGPGQVSMKIAAAVRSGDSGGGVFDSRGRLVGVVWGEASGVTYASTGGPLRQFLVRVLGRRLAARTSQDAWAVAGAPMASSACPDGLCPLVRPTPLGRLPAAPGPAAGAGIGGGGAGNNGAEGGAKACECAGALASLSARIASLEASKQDRGDSLTPEGAAGFARAEELTRVDEAGRDRHQFLLERVEQLAALVGVAGRAAAPMAIPALGVSGPAGWAVLAGASIVGVLAGRWMKRKARVGRREARVKHSDALPPRASQLAPSPEATAAADASFRAATQCTETRQPVERDDREARELLRLSQLEGRDPLQDALAGRLALDRLDAVADGDGDSPHARWADGLRRELRERFNEVAPTKFEVRTEK
jgi:hypothetical protein